MRYAATVLFVLAIATQASASVTTVVVTRENQAQQGVEFKLTTERHPDRTLDTVFVRITFAKKGKLERLDQVLVQVKDGEKLALRAPLELRPAGEGLEVTFHMTPELAKKCVVRLDCPHKPVHAVTSYEVQLGTFLEK